MLQQMRLPGQLGKLPLAILIAHALSACAWAPPQPGPPPASAVTAAGTGGAVTGISPVLETAQGLLGTPYRYGGQSPETGFDCSGLIYYAHQVHGIEVPRTASELFRAAAPVPGDKLRPGDLMFFKTSGRRVSHVGFYVAPGRFLHAPSRGKRVSIADYRDSYWRARFAGAGRIRR